MIAEFFADPTIVSFLKETPIPVIYLLGVIYLFKDSKAQRLKTHEELIELINRYHELSADLVKQLTIIAEELKNDNR